MTEKDILKVHKWLSVDEIKKNLKGVEYIIMAAPTMHTDATTPIHFSIFLNTQETLPADITAAVFDKFCDQYKITKVTDMLNGIHNVAFSLNDQDTAMPMLLMEEKEIKSELETIPMYVFDFECNADGFNECKTQSKTGWTYSYSDDD